MENQIVREARNRFDPELHTEGYKSIHGDDSQLDSLIQLADVKDHGIYYDLGTGNGYVGFEIVKRYKNSSVVGIDITIDSIAKNKEIAESEGFKNIDFINFDGINLPFDNLYFDGGVSRYALHHFPDIEQSIKEIRRVTKNNGFFILSDPKTYDDDNQNFVDRFQKLKPDGHVHFYQEGEIDSLFQKHGFIKVNSFRSFITYPRDIDERYQSLLDNESKEIIKKYRIKIEEHQVFITVECMNTCYLKSDN